ncbi:MAG: HK97 family phage prohead protease [Phycisphaerae bacterium]|nr:HK97 family phage prohead protease [Phycisphaerae bacterium]
MKRKTGGERHEAGRVFRDGIQAEIQVAEAGDGGAAKISGVANSFGVMRSGRIIHPRSLDGYMKRVGSGGPFFGLLAQHGNAEGFATVGRVTRLAATPQGLLFEAVLASGTPLADEARTLIAQKMLTGVSLGWRSLDDASVAFGPELEREDPELHRIMKAAGANRATVFYAIEPVELSLVDVPDDPAARIAARSGQDAGAVGGVLTAAQFEILRADFERSFRRLRKRLIADANEVFGVMLSDRDLSYGEALLDDSIEAEELDELAASGSGCAVHRPRRSGGISAGRTDASAADRIRAANAALDGIGEG